MLIRAAVGGSASSALSNDSNLLALQKQLQDLDMADAVTEALAPKHAPADAVEAKKLVKDQVSALRREEDHKKMVESALEKLRIERESRAKQRQQEISAVAPNANARAKPAVAAPAPAPQPQYSRQDPTKNSAARQPAPAVAAVPTVSRRSPASVMGNDSGSSKGPAAAPAEAKDADGGPRRRRQTYEDQKAADSEREAKQQLANEEYNRRMAEAANKEKSEFRKRQDVMEQARLREEAKAREEQRAKEDAASRQRVDEMRAQAEAAARREAAQRDKERQRQKDEIEQLKKDQQELNRRVLERDRAREEKRTEERKKIEDNRRAAGVGPVLSNDVPDIQISPRGNVPIVNIASGMSRVAEEKGEPTTRERMLQRKLDRQAREDQERADELKQVELDNRRARQQAEAQRRRLYEESPNSVLPKGGNGKGQQNNADMASRLNDKGPSRFVIYLIK
jgi:hypothetical protein